MNKSWGRIVRTLIQLIAGGGLYALTQQLSSDLPGTYAPYLVILYTLIVSAAQNYLEDEGVVKPILKGQDTPAGEAPTRTS